MSDAHRNPADRVLRRAVDVGLLVPALLTGAAIALQLVAIDDLAQQLVTHWGPEGPDGYGPAWVYPVMTALGGLVLPSLLAGSAMRPLARGERSPMLRLMPALAASLAALFSVLSTGLVLTQVGPSFDAGVGWVLALAFGAAAVVGWVAWAAQPSQDVIVPAALPVDALGAGPHERLAWIGRAELGKGAGAVLASACLLLVGLAVWTWALADVVAAAITTGVAILVALLAAAMTVFHVRADRTGLTVRSAVGFPRFAIPAADIASVGVIDVAGLAHFGGWGVRIIPGATGVILRNGTALEVTRGSGRRFVLTLDDAATVAAVLGAVRASQAGGGRDADQD